MRPLVRVRSLLCPDAGVPGLPQSGEGMDASEGGVIVPEDKLHDAPA